MHAVAVALITFHQVEAILDLSFYYPIFVTHRAVYAAATQRFTIWKLKKNSKSVMAMWSVNNEMEMRKEKDREKKKRTQNDAKM